MSGLQGACLVGEAPSEHFTTDPVVLVPVPMGALQAAQCERLQAKHLTSETFGGGGGYEGGGGNTFCPLIHSPHL